MSPSDKQTIISQVMAILGWRCLGFDRGWHHADTNCKYSGIDPRYDELTNAEALFVLEQLTKYPPNVNDFDKFWNGYRPILTLQFPVEDESTNERNYRKYCVEWHYQNSDYYSRGNDILGDLSSSNSSLGKTVIDLAAKQFKIKV